MDLSEFDSLPTTSSDKGLSLSSFDRLQDKPVRPDANEDPSIRYQVLENKYSNKTASPDEIQELTDAVKSGKYTPLKQTFGGEVTNTLPQRQVGKFLAPAMTETADVFAPGYEKDVSLPGVLLDRAGRTTKLISEEAGKLIGVLDPKEVDKARAERAAADRAMELDHPVASAVGDQLPYLTPIPAGLIAKGIQVPAALSKTIPLAGNPAILGAATGFIQPTSGDNSGVQRAINTAFGGAVGYGASKLIPALSTGISKATGAGVAENALSPELAQAKQASDYAAQAGIDFPIGAAMKPGIAKTAVDAIQGSTPQVEGQIESRAFQLQDQLAQKASEAGFENASTLNAVSQMSNNPRAKQAQTLLDKMTALTNDPNASAFEKMQTNIEGSILTKKILIDNLNTQADNLVKDIKGAPATNFISAIDNAISQINQSQAPNDTLLSYLQKLKANLTQPTKSDIEEFNRATNSWNIKYGKKAQAAHAESLKSLGTAITNPNDDARIREIANGLGIQYKPEASPELNPKLIGNTINPEIPPKPVIKATGTLNPDEISATLRDIKTKVRELKGNGVIGDNDARILGNVQDALTADHEAILRTAGNAGDMALSLKQYANNIYKTQIVPLKDKKLSDIIAPKYAKDAETATQYVIKDDTRLQQLLDVMGDKGRREFTKSMYDDIVNTAIQKSGNIGNVSAKNIAKGLSDNIDVFKKIAPDEDTFNAIKGLQYTAQYLKDYAKPNGLIKNVAKGSAVGAVATGLGITSPALLATAAVAGYAVKKVLNNLMANKTGRDLLINLGKTTKQTPAFQHYTKKLTNLITILTSQQTPVK